MTYPRLFSIVSVTLALLWSSVFGSVVSPQVSIAANGANQQLSWPLPDAKTGLIAVQATGDFGSGTLQFYGSLDSGATYYAVGAEMTMAGTQTFNWRDGQLYYTLSGATAPAIKLTFFGATAAPAGAGGGGGGGAVTIANGADVTQGAKADAAVTNPASSGSVISLLKGNLTGINSIDGKLAVKPLGTPVVTADLGVITNTVIHGLSTGGGGGYVDVKVNPSGSLTVESSVTSSALPTGAATEAAQTTANGSLATIANAATAGATAGATITSSNAASSSLVVKASPGTLISLVGYNAKTSAQFIQVHDAASLPGDTAVPIYTFTVPASSNFSLDVPVTGSPFSTGIVACNSSTYATKTLGAADCWFTGVVK